MQENKYLVRLFMVFLFFTLFSASYLLLPDWPEVKQNEIPFQNTTTQNNVPANIIIKAEDKPVTPPPTTSKPEIITKETTTGSIPTTTNSKTTTVKQETNYPINTVVEITGQKYNLNLKENSTAYDAMQQLIVEKQITAAFQEFKGMGYFLEEINGIKNDNQNNKYWIYYINSQPAKIGISNYVLKNNDLITWKYEASKF